MQAINNVVFIMCDTLSYRYLGCYGNDWIKTPNFDRLAREGVLFENTYSEGLPTIPVRRAILTGRYTLPHSGWVPLRASDTTIPDILWWHSINTAMISSTAPMHLPKFGYDRGFDFVKHIRGCPDDYTFYVNDPLYHKQLEEFHRPFMETDENGNQIEKASSQFASMEIRSALPLKQYWKSDEDHHVAVLSKYTIDWLDKVDKGRSFFLWVDCFDPHEPFDPPSVWDPTLKCPYDPDYDGIEFINPIPGYFEGVYSQKEVKHIRALYAEKVTLVDKWIGKIFDKIRDLGLEHNTMVILTSDHGQHLGEGEHGHGILKKSRPWPYDELVHVPLIIKAPGMEAGKRVSTLIQNIDITPTMMEFLNLPKERCSKMQGKSLIPLLKGKIEKLRDFVISGYYGLSWSITTEKYSYIHWLGEQKVGGKLAVDDKSFADLYYTYYGYGDQPLVKEMVKQALVDTFTCVPGSETECPESDELYDRTDDPYQLKNIIENNPEKGKEIFNILRTYIGELMNLEEPNQDVSSGWQGKNPVDEIIQKSKNEIKE